MPLPQEVEIASAIRVGAKIRLHFYPLESSSYAGYDLTQSQAVELAQALADRDTKAPPLDQLPHIRTIMLSHAQANTLGPPFLVGDVIHVAERYDAVAYTSRPHE